MKVAGRQCRSWRRVCSLTAQKEGYKKQVNLMEMGKDTQHFLEPAASANESCKLISDLVHLLYFSSVWLRQTNFPIGKCFLCRIKLVSDSHLKVVSQPVNVDGISSVFHVINSSCMIFRILSFFQHIYK